FGLRLLRHAAWTTPAGLVGGRCVRGAAGAVPRARRDQSAVTVRRLLSTLTTPLISRAMRVASSICAWLSTSPDRVTVPLTVSTSIDRPETSLSASSEDFKIGRAHV